ncbi:MAG: autotransporter-associated beta strand repeat-containing protein [Opitutaceae bacterium]|nr:autotransporter-associated beta strand repeat-containing protein [Opitutaceae bacterium]
MPLTPSSPFVLAGQVQLEWDKAPGATGYNVKRATSADGSFTTIGSPVTESFLDTTAAPGTVYYYQVTSVDATGESAPTPSIQTMPAIAVDNLDTANVTLTGTWSSSTSIAGFYGTNNLFDLTTTGKSVRFRPSLPVSGRYDVYLRWTSHTNRATNTSVEVVDSVGTNLFRVNQQLNGGTWFKLRSFDFIAGTTGSVAVLNTGANGTVIADAVLFVLNDQPLPTLPGYTRSMFEDNFDGVAFDPAVWNVFDYRRNNFVSDGQLRLTTTGDPTQVGTALTTEWEVGGLVTKQFTQRFGYFEAVFQVGRTDGLNNAFWLTNPAGTTSSLDQFEIDIAEAHAHNDNHMTVHDWKPVKDGTGGRLVVPNIYPGYHTSAFEWATDGTMRWYWNGQLVQTKTAAEINAYENMTPVQILFSTKVIPFAHAQGDNGQINSALMNDSSMNIAYVRTWMKPGWTGATDGDWANAANWGPDGIPGAGSAAVFNGAGASSVVSLTANTSVKELYFGTPQTPGMTIASGGDGTARLLLGALASGTGIGGIVVNGDVTASQTIMAPIHAQRDVTFSNFSDNSSVSLNINGPITASTTGRALVIGGGGRVNIGGNISSDFADIKKVNAGTAWLSGNNAFTGNLLIEDGRVVATSPTALGTGGGRVEAQNYTLGSLNFSGTLAFAGGVQYPATKTVQIAGRGDATATGAIEVADDSAASFAGPLIMAASAQIGSGTGTGTLTLASPVDTTAAAFVLTFAGQGTTIMNGAITGAGSLVKNGNGTVRLNGATTVAGSTIVNGGTLVTSLKDFAGAIVNWATVIFEESVDSSSTGNWGGSSGTYIKRGVGTLTIPNTLSTTGTLSIEGGTVRLGAANRFSDSLTLSVNSGGTFDLNAFTDTVGRVVLNGGNIVNSTGTSAQFLSAGTYDLRSGVIDARLGGSASVVKTTPGTVTLAGANSFTGGITVEDGTLELTGSLASSLVVNSGTLGLGASPGIRTISGNVTLNPGGKLRVRIDGPTAGTQHDQLSLSGSLVLGGDLEVLAAPGLTPGSTFRIVNCTASAATVSGVFAGKPANKSFRSGGYDWVISYSGGTGNDVVLTLVSPRQAWRYDYFGTTDNLASAADSFDPNSDGENNFYEFATAQDPAASSTVTPVLGQAEGVLVKTYVRSHAALADGVSFTMEWSDSLAAGTWSSAGVTEEILGDNGIVQTVRASVPIGPGHARFMRLRVSKP